MFRKSWPHFRNPPTAKHNYASVVTALEAEQGPLLFDCSSHPRCSTQSLRSFFLGKLGNGLGSEQYRAKCSSSVQSSRSCHSSIQSFQCLVPSSVSVLRWLPSTSDHTGPAPDMKAPRLKVRRNSSLAVVSSFSDGEDHRGNVEGCTSGNSPWSSVDRVFLFDSEEGEETRSSTAGMDIGTEASRSWESFNSHTGSNLKLPQTKPQPNWNEPRSQNAETARRWSLYLNRPQRGFRPHLSGLKLFNSITPSPSLCTRCKSLVPGVSARVIYSERCMNNVALILRMLSYLKYNLTALWSGTMEYIVAGLIVCYPFKSNALSLDSITWILS